MGDLVFSKIKSQTGPIKIKSQGPQSYYILKASYSRQQKSKLGFSSKTNQNPIQLSDQKHLIIFESNNEHSDNNCFRIKLLLFVPRYTSRNIDELSLHPRDIIQPMGQLEPGWWAGRVVLSYNTKKGIIGVFPSNYVKCFSLEL